MSSAWGREINRLSNQQGFWNKVKYGGLLVNHKIIGVIYNIPKFLFQ